jgi:N6-L-threonylcarbamoyladenine synthase
MATLGIDTSNYRTSAAVIDNNFNLLSQFNPILPVKKGEVGLQQSQAVFEHIKAWPELIKTLEIEGEIEAVGVSTRPRPQEGSYMPVFLVGAMIANTLAHVLEVPLIEISHQEGHIAAGEYSMANPPKANRFLSVHLSGGTSEVLLCERTATGYALKLLGGSLDLHAGQFVDRVGVALGLPFPAGPALERLAQGVGATQSEQAGELKPKLMIPSYVKGVDFSFSGPTSAALRYIGQKNCQPAEVARAVEQTIAKTIEKSLLNAMRKSGLKEIMLVGGVASNTYIAKQLRSRLEHPSVNAKLFFAQPAYATDNAFGVACIAQQVLVHMGNKGGIDHDRTDH